MKTSPNKNECNYTRHIASSPFVKSETGKHYTDKEGEVVVVLDQEAFVNNCLQELVTLTCLACGERWFIKVNVD